MEIWGSENLKKHIILALLILNITFWIYIYIYNTFWLHIYIEANQKKGLEDRI
jgi:hypothetical protein